MLAISPQFCWLNPEDPISHIEQESCLDDYFGREIMAETNSGGSIDVIHNNNYSPPSSNDNNRNSSFADHPAELLFHHADDDDEDDDDGKSITKKLNHNASERDRRRRINSLYASLRALLPPQDQLKKLSIPQTVSRVLKYIPELQQEVENLIHHKETLISRISRQPSSGSIKNPRKRKSNQQSSSKSVAAAVSATQINPNEIIVQSSMPKSDEASFSEAVKSLEDEGFLVINASCFESFEKRVFFNLHLQAQGNQAMDVEMLKEKLLSFCENQN